MACLPDRVGEVQGQEPLLFGVISVNS